MHGIRKGTLYARRAATPRNTARTGTRLRRTTAAAAGAALLSLAAGLLTPGPAQAAPPTPPGASQARSLLAGLTVAAEGSMTGYDRDKFPHWSSQGDNCNTREVVLERDGSGVQTGGDCYPTSGSWYSAYDGATWYQASDLDVDHMVPLAEAWRSGADDWSTSHREDFANDLDIAQLIAVTDNVNQSKGDRDPAEWLPPRGAYHCTYARMWVWVKHSYGLSVDPAEEAALDDVLSGC
ncbi:HNH endonuclease family protein [Streptomyces sp. JJ36]|uniref:HNH endonuclease family protein n=1 Tax=Streptomyces sp. JJ36 TaxID=2736645 RepID=UPI001F474975|nr:HNH endonuclease family protein [Streptomyces sp. JJ36]MCF6521816.1 HNH endonuclease [Streptomyces sp. JJ36]